MCPRDIANRVDHREHDQTECQRDSDVRNRASAHLVNDDRSSPSEHEREGADEFSNALLLATKSKESRLSTLRRRNTEIRIRVNVNEQLFVPANRITSMIA